MSLGEIITYITNIMQIVGGILLSLGYIPQIRKTWKTKSVDDFNPVYYRLVFTGVAFMEIYAINLAVQANAGYMFLITNTVATILSGTMFVLTEKYKKK